MRYTELPFETWGRYGLTHKVTVKASANVALTDLTAAGLTQDVLLFPAGVGLTFSAGFVLARYAYRLKTQFTGGGVTSLTLQLGDSGGVATIMAAKQLLSGAAPILHAMAHGDVASPFQPKVYNVADQIKARFTSITANLNTLTAGEVDIFLGLADLTMLDQN